MIIDMEELKVRKQPHFVFEGICLKCLNRAIHVAPVTLLLKDIRCAKCGVVGFIINTGQELKNENK